MKKLPLLITLGVIVLVVGGYFAFEYLKKKPLKPWDLVPTDALMVYEKDNCSPCLERVSRTTIWQVIQSIANYKKPADTIQSKINQAIATAKGVIVSAHIIRKDDLDFIYYVPISGDFLSASEIAKVKGHTIRMRTFSDVTINEVHFNKQVFSYANIEGVWVGSFTSFLVEDVIRTYRDHGESGKQLTFGSLQFSSIKDDAGNLYVKLGSLHELLSVFIIDPTLNYEFGRSALLDIKADENSLTLNGFSTDSIDQEKYLLSIFQHQHPVSFGLKNLISNRVVAVSSYGISDGENFGKDLQRFLGKRKPRLRDSLNALSANYALNVNNLYSNIADEFAVCFMESPRKNSFSKILMVEVSDARPWTKAFTTLSDRLSIDTVFYEHYSQYEIREVPVFKLAEKMFWPLVTGFEHNYYTVVGKIILIADDLEELKNFLDDIEAEETWGRSTSQNKFLESTLLESNVSLYMNPWRFWNVYAGNFQPRWQNFIKENRSLLQSLQASSFQFSHLNNSYYTNALFTFKQHVAGRAEPKNPGGTVTVFDHGITDLFPVRSHVNRSNEVLAMDSLHNLSLVSSDGKVFWRVAMSEPIISDVMQIDYFANGKLQYFFATRTSLHIIDRLGNYVNGYPKNLPGSEIDKVSVVDYDNSKKYRFLLSDKEGKLSMLDKEGNILDGWNPNNAGGALSSAPRHYRIKGKDYIVAARNDGSIFLWTRRGERIRNFPVDIQAQPVGDIFLERGSTLAETFFVFVTRDGFRVRVTPEGKIQSKETLLRSSVRSTFALTAEKTGKSYLVVQQDERQLTLSDADGRKIVSVPVVASLHGDVKYYDFGAGKRFVTVKDRIQGLYYVYDGQGNLLTTPPVETAVLEIEPLNSDDFTLFFIHGSSLVIQAL